MGSQTKCRKCGCPMEMVMGPKGRFIPVQKVTLLYTKGDDGEQEVLQKVVPRDDNGSQIVELYVSHFQTCSDPARFSRKGGRGS